jgi:hypothetical protein
MDLALVAGLVTTGLVLRLWRLGALGYAGNEDYTVIAARAVAATGLPTFPSGLDYVRGLPLTYVTALGVRWFGDSAFVMRLPSALCSVVAIALAYAFGRRLLGRGPALLVAALMALSDWEVALARTARMYGALSLLFFATAFLAYRAATERGWRPRVAAIATAVIACFLHQQAALLVPVYALIYVAVEPMGARRRFLAGLVAVTLLAMWANVAVEKRTYGRAEAIVRERAAAVPPDDAGAGPAAIARTPPPTSKVARLVRKVADSEHARLVPQRELAVYVALWRTSRPATAIVTALFALALLASAAAALRRGAPRLLLLAAIPIIGAMALQQAAAAGWFAVAYVVAARRLTPDTADEGARRLLAFIALTSVAWLVFGALALEDPFPRSARRAVVALCAYTTTYLSFYAYSYPFQSALALVSIAVAAVHHRRTGRLDGAGLVALVFLTVGAVTGAHPRALLRPYERYAALLDPWFLLLVASGTWHVLGAARRALSNRPPALRRPALGVLIATLSVLVFRESPRLALASVTYGYGIAPHAQRGGDREGLHPDHAGPARYIAERHRPTDVIIASDVLAHYAHFPHVRYHLTLGEPRDAEVWLGATTLTSVAGLQAALDRHAGVAVWIVLAPDLLHTRRADPRVAGILRAVEARAGPPRHTGADGISRVYLAGDPAR